MNETQFLDFWSKKLVSSPVMWCGTALRLLEAIVGHYGADVELATITYEGMREEYTNNPSEALKKWFISLPGGTTHTSIAEQQQIFVFTQIEKHLTAFNDFRNIFLEQKKLLKIPEAKHTEVFKL